MKKLSNITQQIKTAIKPYNNENGFILAAVIILSLMLVMTVTIAIWSADNEATLVRNVGESTQSFYDAETALVAALVNPSDWLTTEFVNDAPATAWSIASVDANGNVQVWKNSSNPAGYTITRTNEIALLHIRPITLSPGTITETDFDERARLTPQMSFGIPENTGDSVIHTKSRFYSVTAITGGNSATEVIQIGVKQTIVNPSGN